MGGFIVGSMVGGHVKSLKIKKLRREGLDLHRLLALVNNSCCYATMQHLMTSFCNI